MLDRLAIVVLVVLLSVGGLLQPFLGSRVNLLLVVPVAALAFRAAVIRPLLSPAYRARVSVVLDCIASRPWHATFFVMFCGLLLISFFRAGFAGQLPLDGAVFMALRWASVVALLFAVAVLADEHLPGDDSVLRAAVAATLLYSTVNAVLYLAGVSNAATEADYVGTREPGVMFSLIGVTVSRVALPLSDGINTGGLQTASSLAFAAVMMVRSRPVLPRVGFALLTIVGACLIMLTDSRGAMAAAVGSIALVLLMPLFLKRRFSWLALTIPALPVLLVLFLQALANQTWLAEFSRSGTNAIALLTGRPLIWASILGSLSDFQLSHLFGYGAMGQVTSGLSVQYGVFFVGAYASPYTMGAHNAVLQAILDVGYVGAAVQILLMWRILSFYCGRIIDSTGTARWTDVGLVGTLCLLLLGITGETFSFTTPATLFLFLAINVHALTASVTSVGRLPRGTTR